MKKNKEIIINKIMLDPVDSIKHAIQILDDGALQIAFVVNAEKRLLGTITDGDIRRAILRGVSLDTPVVSIMCSEFRSLPENATDDEAKSLMSREFLHQIPMLDEKGRITKVLLIEELIKPKTRDNPVVIMAGGEGRRMLPLTEDCPKPMLRVGQKPLLEIILKQCIDAGFQHFYISVRYLKNIIKDYFADGEKWGVQIEYLEEQKPLGTAGALKLLPTKLKGPLLVLNSDILTSVDYGQLIDFHDNQGADATLCVREYITNIPYGVVEIDNSHVKMIKEKPNVAHFVNAGIYVLNPSICDLLPNDQFFDMPDLLERAIKRDYDIHAFPVHEYWLDVGHHVNFEFAQQSWQQ